MSRTEKILAAIKEKTMAMTGIGQYAFGYQDPNQTLLGNVAQQGYSQLGNAAQQATQKSYVQRAQLQMQMAQQQAAMQNAYAQVNPQKSLATFHLDATSMYTFDELNDEGSVYNMSLQTAVDLAINMFGSGWFKDEETVPALEENREFWLKVMAKLFKAGHLQKETVSDFELSQTKTAWKILDTAHAN